MDISISNMDYTDVSNLYLKSTTLIVRKSMRIGIPRENSHTKKLCSINLVIIINRITYYIRSRVNICVYTKILCR